MQYARDARRSLRSLGMTARLAVGMTARLAVSMPAFGQNEPNPREVYVMNMAYGGNGCPQGTVANNLSPDAKAITFLFSDFTVDTPSNGGREVKKSCAINLQLHVPQGWTYTLFSIDYRGYVDLNRNSDLRLRSWYRIGNDEVRIANTTIEGPKAENYHVRAGVPLDALPWLTCSNSSTIININTEIKATGPAALATVDSLDGEVSHQYGIAWRRCSTSTRWQGSCKVVYETQWGSNIKVFSATGNGANHTQAKGAAEAEAKRQCEAERSRAVPLMRAMTKCQTDAAQCIATPM